MGVRRRGVSLKEEAMEQRKTERAIIDDFIKRVIDLVMTDSNYSFSLSKAVSTLCSMSRALGDRKRPEQPEDEGYSYGKQAYQGHSTDKLEGEVARLKKKLRALLKAVESDEA
jgi:hypothetical protein